MVGKIISLVRKISPTIAWHKWLIAQWLGCRSMDLRVLDSILGQGHKPQLRFNPWHLRSLQRAESNHQYERNTLMSFSLTLSSYLSLSLPFTLKKINGKDIFRLGLTTTKSKKNTVYYVRLGIHLCLHITFLRHFIHTVIFVQIYALR